VKVQRVEDPVSEEVTFPAELKRSEVVQDEAVGENGDVAEMVGYTKLVGLGVNFINHFRP
jgi:hypothetical protein